MFWKCVKYKCHFRPPGLGGPALERPPCWTVHRGRVPEATPPLIQRLHCKGEVVLAIPHLEDLSWGACKGLSSWECSRGRGAVHGCHFPPRRSDFTVGWHSRLLTVARLLTLPSSSFGLQEP